MTVSYTPSQTGAETLTAVFWNNAAFSVWGGLRIAGVQFTIPAPDELLFRSLTLTLTPDAVETGTLAITLCDDIDEAEFSGTIGSVNYPSQQATIPLYSATHTFAIGTPVELDLALGVSELQTGTFKGSTETATQVLGHSGFQGVVALVITWSGGLVGFDKSPTLTGDEVPFLSGLPSHKPMSSRADWCPRCGQATFREYMSEDGYTKNLVCSDCNDPAEGRRRRYTPKKEVNP